MIRPADHLRNGWLSREDQAVRDQLIGELYRSGERQIDIADAFLLSRPSVMQAVRRAGARIPREQVIQFRVARRGQQ